MTTKSSPTGPGVDTSGRAGVVVVEDAGVADAVEAITSVEVDVSSAVAALLGLAVGNTATDVLVGAGAHAVNSRRPKLIRNRKVRISQLSFRGTS